MMNDKLPKFCMRVTFCLQLNCNVSQISYVISLLGLNLVF